MMLASSFRGISNKLKLRNLHASQISEELYRSMWELRLNNINLHPNVPAEQDYECFKRFFIAPNAIASTFWDSNNMLQGFYACHIKECSFQGKTYQRAFLDYSFMNKEYRGGQEMNFAIFLTGLKILWLGLGSQKFGVGVAYPSTYLKFCSVLNVYTFNTPGISSYQEAILTDFVQDYFEDSFDANKKLVKMRTLPHPFHVKNPTTQKLIEDYEDINPYWKEGYAVPVIFDLNLSTVINFYTAKILSKFQRRFQLNGSR